MNEVMIARRSRLCFVTNRVVRDAVNTDDTIVAEGRCLFFAIIRYAISLSVKIPAK
jgi:hypothetical protein